MDRPLLLNGFMATGKTTVGRALSEWCGRPFVDLDQRIEQRAGRSVAALFASDGEDSFRRVEQEALKALLDEGGAPVVALGGGALLRREQRLEALDRAVVVTLEAESDEIVRRTAGTSGRPLLEGPDPLERIERLQEQRRDAYLECHARVPTTGRTPDDVSRDVLNVWRRDPVVVAAGRASYSVEIGSGIAPPRLATLLSGASLGFLVSDRNVAALHADPVENGMEQSGARTAMVLLDPGEEHKNIGSLERIWSAALAAAADRKSCFVALGGGVVTDVAGFAAATWMRGVPWIGVPTTLLAMVDASVGGKTAIDLRDAKNQVGAFWQPSSVLCDVSFLSTEPLRGYTSALAEVIKTALIGDPGLLDLIESRADGVRDRDPDLVAEMVRRSVRVKARIVSADERESGLRAVLNLGHTVGHALEAFGGYGKLRHGEAISLGLVAALRIGERLGLTDRALVSRTVLALRVVGLPVDLHTQPLAKAVELIGHDKKRAGGRVRFIVARDVGRVEPCDLELNELRNHALGLVGAL